MFEYRELDFIEIPEAVPELGVEAGGTGVVEAVYAGERTLSVEVPRDDGTSVGFVGIELDRSGAMRVIGYSRLGG